MKGFGGVPLGSKDLDNASSSDPINESILVVGSYPGKISQLVDTHWHMSSPSSQLGAPGSPPPLLL